MGIDQQAAHYFQQGADMVGDVMDIVSGPSGPRNKVSDYSAEAEATARMREADAMGEARDVQSRAFKDARTVRDEREQARSGRNTTWGQSNLAMSGSKTLVREGNRLKDKQAEDDVLFDGQRESQDVLNRGRHDANMLRIKSSGTANRSTLSLGSRIYRQGK